MSKNKPEWEFSEPFNEHYLCTEKKEYATIASLSTGGCEIVLSLNPKTGKPWAQKRAKEFVSKLYNVEE